MGIFEDIAEKYDPDKDEDSVSGRDTESDTLDTQDTTEPSGDIFTDIAESTYKERYEEEQKDQITLPSREGMMPSTDVSDTLTEEIRRRSGTTPEPSPVDEDVLETTFGVDEEPKRNEEYFVQRANDMEDQMEQEELEDFLFAPASADTPAGEVEVEVDRKERVKRLLNAANTQDEIDTIRKATKPVEVPGSDEVIARVERREGRMDEIDKMFKRREQELGGGNEIQPIDHFAKEKETGKLKPPTLKAEERPDNIGERIARATEETKGTIQNFFSEELGLGLTEREAPQRVQDPDTGEVITVEGLAPKESVEWVRGPFEHPKNATPIESKGLAAVANFPARMAEIVFHKGPRFVQSSFRDIHRFVNEKSAEAYKALGVPERYIDPILESHDDEPGFRTLLDPRRVYPDERIYEDDEGNRRVYSPGHWYDQRFSEIMEANPPDGPVDWAKNHALTAVTTAVPDMLSVYLSGKWLQSGGRYLLSKTSYDPQATYHLNRLGIKQTEYTDTKLAKQTMNKLSKTRNKTEAEKILRSYLTIAKKRGTSIKSQKFLEPVYKTWSQMSPAQKAKFASKGQMPKPSFIEKSRMVTENVPVSWKPPTKAGKTISNFLQKLTLPYNKWEAAYQVPSWGVKTPGLTQQLASGGSPLKHMYTGGLRPKDIKNAIKLANKGASAKKIASQLDVSPDVVDIALSAGGPEGLRAVGSIVEENLGTTETEKILNKMPDSAIEEYTSSNFEDLVSATRKYDSPEEFARDQINYYHGALEDFGEFTGDVAGTDARISDAEFGHFFNPTKEKASDYIKSLYPDRDITEPVVKEASVDIKNPLDLTREGILNKKSQAPTVWKALTGEELAPQEAVNAVAQEVGTEGLESIQKEILSDASNKQLLKEEGYDGLINEYDTDEEGNVLKEHVALDSDQVMTREGLGELYDHSQVEVVPETEAGVGTEEVIEGEEMVERLRDIGTEGGWGDSIKPEGDYILNEVRKENYVEREKDIEALREMNSDLDNFIEEEGVREFEGEPTAMNPVVSSEGEVLDGYNRIAQAVEDGRDTIKVWQGVEKKELTEEEEILKSAYDAVKDYDTPEEFVEKGLKYFHAVKPNDLDLINEIDNTIIAPSFGIGISPEAIENYGDTVFVPTEEMLEDSTLYKRDAWTPTLSEVPDTIYGVDKQSEAYRALQRNAGFDVDEVISKLRYKQDPRDALRRYHLQNDAPLVSSTQSRIRLAEDMGWEIVRLENEWQEAEINEMVERGDILRITEEGFVHEDDNIRLDETIAKQLFPELEMTPDNVSEWLKGKFGEDMRGVGSMLPEKQKSIEEIDPENLEEYVENNLREEKISAKELDKMSDKQFEASQKAQDMLGLRDSRGFARLGQKEIIGELAKSKDFKAFKQNIREQLDFAPEKAERILEETPKNELKGLYNDLQDAFVDVPTDYLEAKSLENYPIDEFPVVITNNSEAIQKLKDMGYDGKIVSNWKEFYKEYKPDRLVKTAEELPEEATALQRKVEQVGEPSEEIVGKMSDNIDWLDTNYDEKLENIKDTVDNISKEELQKILEKTGMTPEIRKKVRELGGLVRQNPAVISEIPDQYVELMENTINDGLILDTKFYPMTMVKQMYQQVEPVGDVAEIKKLVQDKEPEVDPDTDPNQREIENILANVWMELDVAEAGDRIAVPSEEIGEDYRFLAKKSTFPKWIPSDLRETPLLDEVMDHMENGTIPSKKRASRLYETIQDEIAERANISRDKLNKLKAELEGISQPTRITDEIKKQLQDKAENLVEQATVEGEPDDLQKIIKKNTEKRATRRADFVGRKRETTLLKDRIKNIARGVREGRISTKNEIEDAQTELIDMIESSDIRAADRAKFIRTIKNTQTTADLQNAVEDVKDRIGRYSRKEEKRTLQDKIDKELKYTKPVKKGDYRVGKYNYEKNELFKTLRKYNNLSQADAQEELAKLPTKDLDEKTKIKSRFLSYKANGMKGSVQIHEDVLDDIKWMKQTGRKAKNDKEFKKLLEREKDKLETEEAIASIKGDKDSILTRIENGYRRGKTDSISLFETIMGPEKAKELDPGLNEIKKKISTYKTGSVITEKIKDLLNLDSAWQTQKKIHGMSEKQFEIKDKKEGEVHEVSKWGIIDVYNATKNDLIAERFDEYYGMDKVEDLLDELTQAEKDIGDYLMKQVQGYKQVFNKHHREKFGRDMGKVKNYWPSSAKYTPDVIYDDFRQKSEVPSQEKSRVNSKLVVPEIKNALRKTMFHVRQGEHVRHISRKYERLKRIFDDPDIENLIKKKFGDKILQRVKDEVEKFSLQTETSRDNIIDDVINFALNNWTANKIVNLTSPVRQLGSLANFAAEMPTDKFMSYMDEAIKNPRDAADFVWDHVGDYLEMRFNRGYNEATTEAIQGANKLQAGMGNVRKTLTTLIRMGDIGPMIIGGYPKLKWELEKHGDREKAINEYIQNASRHQQSPMEARRDPGQMSDDAIVRLVHRFLNYPSQMTRQSVNALINLRNGNTSGREATKKILNYMVLQPILYVALGSIVVKEGLQLIGRKMRGEEKKVDWSGYLLDMMQGVMTSPVMGIPIANQFAEWGVRQLTGRKTYGVYELKMFGEMKRALQKLAKDDPSGRDMLEGFASLQEFAAPIPSRNMLRYHDYVMGVGQEEAEMRPFYNRVQKKLKQGKEEEAVEMVESLSEKEKEVYDRILRKERAAEMEKAKEEVKPIFKKTQKMIEEGKEEKAVEIVEKLSEKYYEAYQELLEEKKEKEEAAKGNLLKSVTEPDLASHDHIIALVSAYAQALGTDPTTAFQTMFTDEKLRKVEGDTVIIQRMPIEESQEERRERMEEKGSIEGINDLTELRLDHTVPLQLGGDNSEDNLELVPKERHDEFTEVGNHLGELLRDGEISGSKARELIKDYKEGRIPREKIMEK